ncbi:MAG TPA: hypothetical protein VGI81_27610, partial [Tepidisphaeraceae bacterium]
DFSRAVTGTLFFVPSATFLEGVAALEATPSPTGPPPDAVGTGPASGSRRPPPDGSLGIGSLKGKAAHE